MQRVHPSLQGAYSLLGELIPGTETRHVGVLGALGRRLEHSVGVKQWRQQDRRAAWRKQHFCQA